MTSIWTVLLMDTAIIIMIVWSWGSLFRVERRLSRTGSAVFFGALMGLGAAALMLEPVHVSPGVFVDLRGVLVALAGFFGGPAAAIVAAAISITYRICANGDGMTAGVLSIAVAGAVGTAGHLMIKGRLPAWKEIAVLAVVLAAATLACLLALPAPLRNHALPIVWLPLGSIVVLATFAGGLAFRAEIRRREVAQSNLMYRQVIDALPDCLNVKDMEGRFIFANPATAALMQAPRAAALVGKTDLDFYPAKIAKAFRADEIKLIESGKPLILEQHFFHQDGRQGWLSTLKAPLLDEKQDIVGLISHNRDITERKTLEYKLAESQQHLVDALTNMEDGLAMFDSRGTLVFCNTQYTEMFSKTSDIRVAGRTARDILQASIQRGEIVNLPDLAETDLDSCVRDHFLGPNRRQYRLFDNRWIETRARFTIAGACFVISTDITALKNKEAELLRLNAQLEAAANTDGLTGLANRRAFDARLEQDLYRSRRNGEPLSLLLIDADHFKSFNDTQGHVAGDDALRQIALCVMALARRAGDLAARYGGEEMALILPQMNARDALAAAHDLCARVRGLAILHPASLKGVVTVSTGLATLDGPMDDTIDVAGLVGRADDALYAAKSYGRDAVFQWRQPQRQINSGGRGARR